MKTMVQRQVRFPAFGGLQNKALKRWRNCFKK
jgi:hypothetical protein